MPTSIPTLRSLGNLRGKRVLLRAAFNVPLTSEGDIANDFRIRRALPTIEYLVQMGARTTILSHLGDGNRSLSAVAQALSRYTPVSFVPDLLGREAKKARENLQNGQVLLLENVRSDSREMANDPRIASQLAQGADLYINDAFADSHRSHASIVGIPKVIPGAIGFLVEEEAENLSKALHPESPSLFILGGAKFATKEPLIKKFIDIYDHVFVGGAVANDFFKAKGYEVGHSLLSSGWLRARELMNHPKLLLPSDVTVASPAGKGARELTDIKPDDTIHDIGPKTLFELSDAISNSRFVLWNGPLGNYEMGYTEPTEEIAKVMSSSSAYSVVGGGDTVASIGRLKLEKNFSFLSTGGGAMLAFLQAGTLDGIEALKR